MYLTEVKIFHSGNRTICCRINRLHNMSKILNGLSSFAQHAGHILLFSELCARWLLEFNITPPTCINYYKRQPWCLFHVNNRTGESSSRWISASIDILSSITIRLRQRFSANTRLSYRRRSGSSGDSCSTTSHLCTTLHMNLTTTRRCPGLVCWTCVRDDTTVSHLIHT